MSLTKCSSEKGHQTKPLQVNFLKTSSSWIANQRAWETGREYGIPESVLERVRKVFWTEGAKSLLHFGSLPTTPDPNASAKVSRYKWEPHRDINWWCIYYNPAKRRAYFCSKSNVVEMGGVSRYFHKYRGQGSI